jgi:hypothetical protein
MTTILSETASALPVMGHIDAGKPKGSLKVLFLRIRRRSFASRLKAVHQTALGFQHQRAGNGYTLLLATGHF